MLFPINPWRSTADWGAALSRTGSTRTKDSRYKQHPGQQGLALPFSPFKKSVILTRKHWIRKIYLAIAGVDVEFLFPHERNGVRYNFLMTGVIRRTLEADLNTALLSFGLSGTGFAKALPNRLPD